MFESSLDIDELKLRITEAIVKIDRSTLEIVWDAVDWRLEICRVTNAAHIEHLQGT
jgi:hypothetical protein